MPFFIIFIIIPLLELMVFGAVGEEVGLFNALLLALLTAVIGGAVVRHQGMQTLRAVQDAMGQGKMPLGELFDGICLVAAGATLITPGFITDTVGFLLLIPAVREALRHVIKNHTTWSAGVHTSSNFQQHPRQNRKEDDVIDAEFEHIDDDKLGN